MLLIFGLSFAVATGQELVAMLLQTGATAIKQWGGRILIAVGVWLIVLALAADVLARFFPVRPEVHGQTPMSGMSPSRNPTPAVKGFVAGQEIRFIHTEASDPQVAGMLTRMMGPKVLVVKSLGEVPSALLARVFVFRNGVKGEGPFGFQPDVFDAPPSEAAYTPLRRVNFVTWREGRRPRVLRSVAEIGRAQAQGDVTVVRSAVVVNMPMLTWPGGQR